MVASTKQPSNAPPAVPSTIPTEASAKSPSLSPSIVLTTSPNFDCGCIDRAAQHDTHRSIREESQSQSEYRTHDDESSGASFVPSDCGVPYCIDRAAQLCSDGGFFQWCFVRGAGAQHNIDQSTHRESQSQSEYRTHDESEL